MQSRSLYINDILPVLLYKEKCLEDGFVFDQKQEEALSVLQGSYALFSQEVSWWQRILPTFLSASSQKKVSSDSFEFSSHGVYFWGDVGRGKSMLMDLFFESLATSQKRRYHCHAFMDALHHILHKQVENKSSSYQFKDIVEGLIQDAVVVCFDEMHLRDIADATLLQRVLEYFFENGIFFVCTSNVPPQELYKNGLKREYFTAFFNKMSETLVVLDIAIDQDYRRRYEVDYKAGGACIKRLMHERQEAVVADIKGRDLFLHPLGDKKVCISFDELCLKARGFDDFVYLALMYDVIVLSDVPQDLSDDMLDGVRRFMTLIDIVYDGGKLLLVDGAYVRYKGEKVAFEFERITSRLYEMLSNALKSDLCK